MCLFYRDGFTMAHLDNVKSSTTVGVLGTLITTELNMLVSVYALVSAHTCDKNFLDLVNCLSWSQTKQFFLMQFLHYGCLKISMLPFE